MKDLIKHARTAESTLSDVEPVSAVQFKLLQEELTSQFQSLAKKLGSSSVGHVDSRSPTPDRSRDRRVRFESPTRGSTSRDRRNESPRRRDDGANSYGYRESRDRTPRWTTDPRREVFRPSMPDMRYVPSCGNCGNFAHDEPNQCPAIRRNIRCNQCFKYGHYARMCRSTGGYQPQRSRGYRGTSNYGHEFTRQANYSAPQSPNFNQAGQASYQSYQASSRPQTPQHRENY